MISVTRKKSRHEKYLAAQAAADRTSGTRAPRPIAPPASDCRPRDPTGRSRGRTGKSPFRCLRARSPARPARRRPTSSNRACSFAATASMSRLRERPCCFIHSTICTISTHATSTMRGLEIILRVAGQHFGETDQRRAQRHRREQPGRHAAPQIRQTAARIVVAIFQPRVQDADDQQAPRHSPATR